VHDGTFTQNDGTINGNSTRWGGGVYVGSSGTFTQSGGEISGNSTSGDGGGVLVWGTFTMSSGTISGNSASNGGGVWVIDGTFTKQAGGIIYGSDASGTLRNTAINGDSYGHAVYVPSSPVKKRDNTAGVGVTLDSRVSDSAGGWE
jgi:hypothetical protein